MKVIKRQKNGKLCVVCGLENDLGLKASFYELEDHSLAGLFSYKEEHQSYPLRVHGGMIACLIDEMIGRVIWCAEEHSVGVTTSLNLTYRKPVPYDKPLKARAILTHNSSMWFSAHAYIYDMDNNLLAEGVGRYLKLPEERIAKDVDIWAELAYDLPLDITDIDFPEIKQ